ncbi:hypothetical protein [Streptomyces griseocarneus]|uniref:hypothetical protein n=1 Tax=Streptomyces griseocarneus TaxID=51201 RepID=UPI0019CE8EFF|nr:hypothetical protein [Streptomyces griseocarneus]GHG78073.1 hypothetical protein GCM10018779_57570 [Streptomyces griseocarneus]
MDHGVALRRAGRSGEAEAQLSEGLVLAEECGAEGLAATAREEVAALAGEEGQPVR